jgi:hypothetical protein
LVKLIQSFHQPQEQHRAEELERVRQEAKTSPSCEHCGWRVYGQQIIARLFSAMERAAIELEGHKQGKRFP